MFYQIKFSDAEVYVFADEDDARAWYVADARAFLHGVASAGSVEQPEPEPQAIWSEAAKRKTK